MKILEQGDKHIEVPKKITCNNCASILEYLKEDTIKVKETRYDQREGSYTVSISVIECPVCSKKIKI